MYINNKHKQIVEDRGYEYIGSYKRDEITVDGKNIKYNIIYIRIKCFYCDNEYDVSLQCFKRGDNCTKCCQKYENSFAYYIQIELGEGLSKYWDWEKNELNPYCINRGSDKKVWIKCTKTDYHGSYKISCNNFYNNKRCPYCCNQKVHPKDSFGQWLIDTYGNNALDKYWSDKNTIDPFTIAPAGGKKVWIKCQEKDYHGSYETICSSFTRGDRCPYCTNQKIHTLDSFGSLYPEKAKYWSKKNKKSPYEVAPCSSNKYWFYCKDCGNEFQTALHCLIGQNRSMKCLNCNSSKGEQKINNWLKENDIDFIPQKEFEGLLGTGGKNLSYDFYLPSYNLLIEYQGEFHDGTAQLQTKEDFKRQQEHDKRKFNYAKNNNINLLEIWYYDYNNIENILEKIID